MCDCDHNNTHSYDSKPTIVIERSITEFPELIQDLEDSLQNTIGPITNTIEETRKRDEEIDAASNANNQPVAADCPPDGD